MNQSTSHALDTAEQLRLEMSVRITEAQITEADRIAKERVVLGFPDADSAGYAKIILQALASNYLAATVLGTNCMTVDRNLPRGQRTVPDHFSRRA